MIPNFTVSKVGVPTGVKPWRMMSHDFMLYLHDDAQFVINRFWWGGWGVTVRMDKDGLASALVQMGNNEPRLTAILLRLDENQMNDAEDVAIVYVNKMMSNPSDAAALKTMRNSPLVLLLIPLISRSRDSAEAKACIDYLKHL
jgi:hypothetical protein